MSTILSLLMYLYTYLKLSLLDRVTDSCLYHCFSSDFSWIFCISGQLTFFSSNFTLLVSVHKINDLPLSFSINNLSPVGTQNSHYLVSLGNFISAIFTPSTIELMMMLNKTKIIVYPHDVLRHNSSWFDLIIQSREVWIHFFSSNMP